MSSEPSWTSVSQSGGTGLSLSRTMRAAATGQTLVHFNSKIWTLMCCSGSIFHKDKDDFNQWEPSMIWTNENGPVCHRLNLAPGEMVWYESARLLHGRPEPLAGDYYDNLFIHFSPTHWYSEEVEVGQTCSFISIYWHYLIVHLWVQSRSVKPYFTSKESQDSNY